MIISPPKDTFVKSFDVLRSLVYLRKDFFYARTVLVNNLYIAALINTMVCCRP